MAGLLVGGLFWPYFSKGKIPIAIDIPTGMYYPWLNYNYGYPARVPVKNAILTDTVSQFWIWRNWAMEGLKKGGIKLWNPYSFAGYPMSPWFQTIMLSPLNIFYWLTNKLDAMAWVVISQMIISLVGGYLLGKKWFKSEMSGWGLAIIWGLSSYFVGWLTWGTVSLALGLLPWALWLVDSRWLPIVLALIVFSGHPQTIFYVFLILLIYFLIKKEKWTRVVGVLGLTALITAIAWLPSVEILAKSIRLAENGLKEVDYGFIPMGKLLITLASVNFFGNPGTNNYWGGDYNFQEKLVSFGVVGLFLAIYQMMRKKNQIEKMGLICLICGWLLATKYPVGWLIYFLKIPLLASGPAGRAFIIAIFGGCILAASALRDKLEIKAWRRAAEIAAGWMTMVVILAASNQIALRNSLVSLVILILGIIMVRVGRKELVIGLIAIEGILFFKKYTPFVDKNLYFPQTKTLEFLESDKTFFRIERESAELLPPNMWQVYELYSTSGYDPIYPLAYSNFLINRGLRKIHSRYVENGDKGIEKLDDLGIKYLLVLEKNGRLPVWVDKNNWTEVFREGPVITLLNKNFRPPYSFGGKINLIKKTDESYVFETEAETENKLVLFENYWPGWETKIDGQATKIELAENTFKSVMVPKGKHRVEFKYKL